MKKLDELKSFLEELKQDKATIFIFEKVSNFERELFISLRNILNEKYEYELMGLTGNHLVDFKESVRGKNVYIDEDIYTLITGGFNLFAMLTKRNISLGYGESESTSTTVIENKNLISFIETLEEYIKIYEKSLKNTKHI
ncbi:hypothetical protein I0292_26505 (plasmid) [Priestia megaterium]|uniref:hypothetical protein n=1 Tax=Priestia megaterium TaxID=1404 RepID=UPI0020588E6E|nr:hypothetical protein [Priestia megaterium]UOO43802.1 hypothetical protein I0292_26505 [Priestia megaterium]